MANTLQTLSTHTNENKTFYERTLLSRLLPKLCFYQYGQKRQLPKHEGDTINFRRFNSLSDATSALTEGAPGDGTTLDITAITAQLSQYGNYVTMSDKLMTVGIDQVMTEAAELLGENAASTIDALTSAVVGAGTYVQYASTSAGTNSITTNDLINGDLVAKAVRTLRGYDAQPVKDGYFIGIIHPYVAFDLRNDPLWQDVSKYNGGEAIKKGEIGKIHGVRFIESTKAPYAANTSEVVVYKTCIIGKDAYGVIDLESQGAGKPSIITKDLGSGGTSDPLDQKASVGWKAAFVAKRLQEKALCRIESAASSQSSTRSSADLSSLTFGLNALTPAFDPEILYYSIAVANGVSSVTPVAIAADGDSTIVAKHGTSTITNGSSESISTGKSTFTFAVTNGTTSKTYTVDITRAAS